MTPATKAIDHLQSLTDWRHAWLIRAGVLAKQSNEASKRDGDRDRNLSPTDQ